MLTNSISWIEISIALLPFALSIIGVFIKIYITTSIQNVKISNLENKVEHINSNWKQRDIALLNQLEELKKEIKHLSIQIAEIHGQQQQKNHGK